MKEDELDFLRESNNIEQEFDDRSLQDAILAWQYLKKQKKLSTEVIKETHRLLMFTRLVVPSYNFDDGKGKFRNGAVWIGGHEAKSWIDVPGLIAYWIKKSKQLLEEDLTKVDKEALTKMMHIEFESIHPFFDGNGRTGRMLYNWQRIRIGLPIHVIHVGKEQFEYYRWFE